MRHGRIEKGTGKQRHNVEFSLAGFLTNYLKYFIERFSVLKSKKVKSDLKH